MEVTVGTVDTRAGANDTASGTVEIYTAATALSSDFEIQNGSVLDGNILIGPLTNQNVVAGAINSGRSSTSISTNTGGSITLNGALTSSSIELTTGALSLTSTRFLSSGSSLSGGIINVRVTNASSTQGTLVLQAIGSGSASGGNILYEQSSTALTNVSDSGNIAFDVSGGATGNSGQLNAQFAGDVSIGTNGLVGTSGGNGGEVHVSSAGNITVAAANAIDLAGADGKGAIIEFNAGTDGTGTLALGSNTGFFTQANGTGANGDGGALIFEGANITYAGGTTDATALALTARGVGNGDGGTIIFKTDDTTATFVGAQAKAPKQPVHFLTADASAGAGGTGDGGNLVIEVGGNLTISDTTAVLASRGSGAVNANGASYTFKAGQAANGALIINGAGALGSIDASAVGGGDGGIVNLSSRSSQVFSVNKAGPKNGIAGTVKAVGANGEINITNLAGGILVQTDAALQSPEMKFVMGGSKGSFTTGAGVTIDAPNLLTSKPGAAQLVARHW